MANEDEDPTNFVEMPSEIAMALQMRVGGDIDISKYNKDYNKQTLNSSNQIVNTMNKTNHKR